MDKSKIFSTGLIIISIISIIFFGGFLLYQRGYQAAYTDFRDGVIEKEENINCKIEYEKLLVTRKYSK